MTVVGVESCPTASPQRVHLTISGMVQGVGFRPFVYRLATDLGLAGWVSNTAQGVVIDIEGDRSCLDVFIHRIYHDSPPHASIQHLQAEWLPPQGISTFTIHQSESLANTAPSALILPDLATCPACLQEIRNPVLRRYGYPFTNCTHCGPRFTILQALPYDRPQTTMHTFPLCAACRAEYEDVSDRRFHAQPIACPHCGPHLELWNAVGERLVSSQKLPALTLVQRAAEAIRQGQVLALKGLGGFQLVVDACNEEAIERLRQRKHRPEKPLALMYPSLEQVYQDCEVSAPEAEVLSSAMAPIVLLKRREHQRSAIAPAVAPQQACLGVMLPYTPLHYLLLAELQAPVVATSGNRTGEPICANEDQAVGQLEGIADLFLVHNRAIATPVDDSVVQVVMGQPQVLRRARGYAPLPVQDAGWANHGSEQLLSVPPCVLALGGHLKSAIALSLNEQIFLSHYLGDLDTIATMARLEFTIAHLLHLYTAKPVAIACDAHPDYQSTRMAEALAQSWAIPLIPVQHHYAHVLSVMVEHGLSAPLLGIAWDGTGYGSDGTIWGGEALAITATGFERFAHLKPFPLPGGAIAAQEPRRSAMGLLYTGLGTSAFEMSHLAPLQAFSCVERRTLQSMLNQGTNTPPTSSMGRLFDAIASLLNLCQRSTYEGQAARCLQEVIEGDSCPQIYSMHLESLDHAPIQVNWTTMLVEILHDLDQAIAPSIISAKVHRTLARSVVDLATCYYSTSEVQANLPVVLSGGCFQNRYLLEQTVIALREAGFTPYWSQRIPSNDGGLAAGQVLAVWRSMASYSPTRIR